LSKGSVTGFDKHNLNDVVQALSSRIYTPSCAGFLDCQCVELKAQKSPPDGGLDAVSEVSRD